MYSETTIEISQELYRKIRAKLDESGFDSVDEYVEFVMNEFVSESEEGAGQPDVSEDDEKKIKERLRSLGYLR
jgi:hypothetical protein